MVRKVCVLVYQKNFEGEKVPDYVYDIHYLKHNEIKLFKKCGRVNCNNDVGFRRINKDKRIICIDCLIYLTRYQKSITKYF